MGKETYYQPVRTATSLWRSSLPKLVFAEGVRSTKAMIAADCTPH